MELYKSRDWVNALEIGCIEHPNGGDMTTKAICESILDRGALTTIDFNSYNIQIAKFHCDRPDHNIRYICGECREVLRKAPFEPGSIDFFLPHFADYYEGPFADLILETFILAEPYLNKDSIVLFYALPLDKSKPDKPTVGKLQEYLSQNHYDISVIEIPKKINPRRWYVIARSGMCYSSSANSELAERACRASVNRYGV